MSTAAKVHHAHIIFTMVVYVCGEKKKKYKKGSGDNIFIAP